MTDTATEGAPNATATPALLEVEGLVKHFRARAGGFGRSRGGVVHAVDGVSFTVAPGETLALVGESGSGKSTTARVVVRLLAPTSGVIRFDGREIQNASRRALRDVRRRLQIVFQDPYASLDPRLTVGAAVAEPLVVDRRRAEARHRVGELLELVGLGGELASRFPHELSGGQRQRVAIARALALEPEMLVLDEPVTALDVSIQAQVLNLLADLRERLSLACLLIAHDLAVVRHVADRVAVMHLGTIVETGSVDDVCTAPAHPYAQALLSAAPVPDPVQERARRRIVLHGELPSARTPPS